jgi:cytochrome c553
MEKTKMKVHVKQAVVLVCGAAAAILIAGAMSLTVSQQANAKPEFAAQTGKACGACHANPGGGGKLTAAGEKFKANGFK